MVQKHLTSSTNEEAEDYLRKMKVVPKGGSCLKGLDFTDSVLFINGTDNICVSVRYEVKVVDFFGHDIKLKFRQRAKTKGWMDGVSDVQQTPSEKPSETQAETQAETQEETTTRISIEELVEKATIKRGKDVMIGDPGVLYEGYTTEAPDYYATCFDPKGIDFSGYSQESVYKKFIDTQISNGTDTFLLYGNPEEATGLYKVQYDYIKSKGYTVAYDEAIDLWIARK